MNRGWKVVWMAVAGLGAAVLACGPLNTAGQVGEAAKTLQAVSTQAAAAASAFPTQQAAAVTPTLSGSEAVTTEAAGAPTQAPTEAATEAAASPTPTYDAISAQLTVGPLLTANAATATLASAGLRQWAAAAQASSQYGETGYAAVQAVGTPNYYPNCGDNSNAWASANSTGPATLTLAYTTPVVPVAVNIYETNAPGSIVRVDVVDTGGTATTVYAGAPLVSQVCPRIFGVPVTGVSAKVNKVVVYLDQTVVGTWNEIDAVELVGNP